MRGEFEQLQGFMSMEFLIRAADFSAYVYVLNIISFQIIESIIILYKNYMAQSRKCQAEKEWTSF